MSDFTLATSIQPVQGAEFEARALAAYEAAEAPAAPAPQPNICEGSGWPGRARFQRPDRSDIVQCRACGTWWAAVGSPVRPLVPDHLASASGIPTPEFETAPQTLRTRALASAERDRAARDLARLEEETEQAAEAIEDLAAFLRLHFAALPERIDWCHGHAEATVDGLRLARTYSAADGVLVWVDRADRCPVSGSGQLIDPADPRDSQGDLLVALGYAIAAIERRDGPLTQTDSDSDTGSAEVTS